MSNDHRSDSAPARRPAVVVRGVLGWGNYDNGTNSQLNLYGPGGRWSDNGLGGPHGDLLAEALEREGLDEGTRLVIVALPRFCALDADEIETAVRKMVKTDG